MKRYLKALSILAVATAAMAMLPASAGAGCPGCEEYTLDIPEDDPEAAPAPGAAPAPVSPAAPAVTTTPAPGTSAAETQTATETETAIVPLGDQERRRPTDPDDDPVPGDVVKAAPLSGVPAVAATQAADLESSRPGGVMPLAIAMVAVAVVGAVLGIRRREAPPAPPSSTA